MGRGRLFFAEHAFATCAGDWLLEKQVKCIGLDLANIDVHDNMKREVHLKLLSAPIYIVENLVNLEQLPLHEHFTFMALPLKLKKMQQPHQLELLPFLNN